MEEGSQTPDPGGAIQEEERRGGFARANLSEFDELSLAEYLRRLHRVPHLLSRRHCRLRRRRSRHRRLLKQLLGVEVVCS